MVKDLLLIFLFLVMIYKYRSLYKDMIAQREYYIKTLSHDLRVSTLAQIRGLEVLAKSSGNNELLKDINNSCKYTLDMINMLLNTYRFDNNEQVLNYEFFNCSELIKSTCYKLDYKAQEKLINFKFDFEDQNIIEADKEFLTKAVSELIDTSIFNAERNSTIMVIVKKRENNLEFSVVYHGKSLSEEECRRMFCKNPRFSTVGHGIKMHLCKKIIEFHGGEIKVFSTSNDINIFKFTIPSLKKKKSCKAPMIRTLQPFNM